jgi:hypothetical protein
MGHASTGEAVDAPGAEETATGLMAATDDEFSLMRGQTAPTCMMFVQ